MGSYNFRSLDNGVLSIGRTETAEDLTTLAHTMIYTLMFEIGYGYYDGFQTLADTWKLEQYLDNVDFESKRKFDYAKL